MTIYKNTKTNEAFHTFIRIITRLRRGRKPLQTLRMKSFLIETHERLTEDLNSSTLLW